MYRTETASRRVEREIAALREPTRSRIVAAIRALADSPRPSGARKLSGAMRGAWRIRVGDYRVLYDVMDHDERIVILAVVRRRDAYRSR